MKRFLPAISGYAPIQRFEKPIPKIYYAPEWRLDKSGKRKENMENYSPMNNYGIFLTLFKIYNQKRSPLPEI